MSFDVKDAFHSGRSITKEVDGIIAKTEQERRVSSNDITKELNIHYQF